MNLVRAEYEVRNNSPIIWLFCRENGKRFIKKINDFKPYFYVLESEQNKIKGIKKDDRIYYSVYGDKLLKVFVTLPGDVPELRQRYSKTWEADILFPIRYIIDKVDSLDYVKQKVLYIDIETNSSGRIPDIEAAHEELICITVCIDYIYTSWIFRTDLTPGKSHQLFEDSLHEIRFFQSEIEMLKDFVTYFRIEEPDIITGWNSSRFDLPYLVNRMSRLGIDSSTLSPMGSVYLREFGQEVVVKGVSNLDLYDTYRWLITQQQGQEESYKLDYIAKKNLITGKTESSDNVRWLWTTSIDRLLHYNTNDCSILVKLDDKLRLIDFVDETRRLCFCNLEDTLTVSRISDSYILRMFHNKLVFPTRTEHKKHEFEGGFVDSWGKGVYKNVVVFDLKSLYPSIIFSLNLSPETVSNTFMPNSIKVDKIYSKREPLGFLPQVIEKLFEERNKYKKIMSQEIFESHQYKICDVRQYSLKVLMNALYGQTAYINSRIFDARVAETTTYIGREINKWSRDFIENLGYQVLYADTDSVHFVLDELDIEQVSIIQSLLNESYTEYARKYEIEKHIFSIEFEKIYKRAFYSGKKKRYAGSLCYKGGKEVDKLEIWGIETRRSDASQFSKKIMENVLSMILKQDKTKEEVTRWIGEEIDRIRKGNFKFSEIGIPKGIRMNLSTYKSPGAHIKGAMYSEKVLKLQLSSKPKMIYIKKLPEPFPTTLRVESKDKHVESICFDEDSQVPPGTVIDIEKMLDKTVKNKLKPIFEALGWSMKEMDYHWVGKAPKVGKQLEMTV